VTRTPSGLLFFPITPFATDMSVNFGALREHLESGMDFAPGGVFVACGAGEFHALSEGEVKEIAKHTVEVVGDRAPIYLGVGGPIQSARNIAKHAEDLGISGLLVFPPYMVTPTASGFARYFRVLADASSLPLIAYNRPGSILDPDLIRHLLEIESVVGFKDGLGDMTKVSEMVQLVKDWKSQHVSSREISFMNGTPTAEISALNFLDLGITTYSSAVLSFAPEISTLFYKSLIEGEREVIDRLTNDFYLPLAALRDEVEGGAISIIKAGNRIRGNEYGGVRTPFLDFNGEQTIRLASLMSVGMDIVAATR
jgi:5-dehydro-4-deoxyglucarate dehydratase